MQRLFKAAAGALVLVLTIALSGCTINIGTGPGMLGPGMMGNNGEYGRDAELAGFSPADLMFAQMMIPHHQQAVDMGTLAESRAENAEVKTLAATIKAEQAPEIAQMQGWLDKANVAGSAPEDMDHMGHGMGGMLTKEDLEALTNASGAEFDRLYLTGMIEHHRGAISMAQMVVSSENEEVRKLAEAIIESQTEQITFMESLLAKL